MARNIFASNPPGTTQTPDGCVVNSKPGELGRCQHDNSGQVPDHVTARRGQAGHQRRS